MIIIGMAPSFVTSGNEKEIVKGIPLGHEKVTQKQTFKINGEVWGKIKLVEHKDTGILQLVDRIKSKTVYKKNVSGEYTGANNYGVQVTTVSCPSDFVSDMLYYRKDLGNGQDCLFNKIDYNIFSSENLIGVMRQYIIAPTGTTNISYSYIALNFNRENYYIYPVNVDKKGYFCFYKDNVLLAIMEMPNAEIAFAEYCTIYVNDDVDKDFICLISGIICTSDELKSCIYQGSLLNDKFDSNFIERIKAVN